MRKRGPFKHRRFPRWTTRWERGRWYRECDAGRVIVGGTILITKPPKLVRPALGAMQLWAACHGRTW
jgi:hypothetical protein